MLLDKYYHKKTLLKLALLMFAVVSMQSCWFNNKTDMVNDENKKEIARWYYSHKMDEDSLKIKLKQYINEGNKVGVMLGYKQLGLYYRENSRFTEAIFNHQENLSYALKLNDTIEIVQAYNNLGTDFRRIAAHGEASDYHYTALNYAEAYSKADVPGVGMKNKVVALNGIGNISLTLGYLDHAEEHLRRALQDERKMDSDIGQAINYANIGAIFEKRGQLDSAHIYYNKSLDYNKLAKSDMGIGLCLIHIGNLYEKDHKLKLAKAEYLKAYELMDEISDRWHWLEACISIARINLLENNFTEFEYYAALAEQTAHEINSPEHLAGLYLLRHDKHLKQSNHKQALEDFKIYKNLQDSVQGVQKTNRFLDVRLNYEQRRNMRDIERIEAENKSREEAKQRALYLLLVFSILGLGVTALLYYAYRQRVKSNRILKDLEQYRTEFYTNITHEFRTPLTVIRGFNNLISEEKTLSEKELAAYHAAIDRQSNNLLQLINELLDIAKLKSGKENPTWYKGDIIAYLRMIVETFQILAKEKEVSINFYTTNESQEMEFIPFYIDKIVGNILSNAIKFTDAGDKIDFIVAENIKNNSLVLRIVDTGVGMTDEEQKHIFEMFYQSQSKEQLKGSGIGLHYTMLLVEKMRGNLQVDSKIGEGTSFIVTLPLKNKAAYHVLPLQNFENKFSNFKLENKDKYEEIDLVDEEKEFDNSKELPIVLVVEDNKDVNTYIKSILKDQYRIITARNGQEALSIAERQIPDVIVSDLMMPVMDGFELCHKLKESVLLNHIPIILLTAKTSDEDRIKGLKCGAMAYIKKPFNREELEINLENLLNARKSMVEKYLELMSNTSHNSHNFNDKLDSDANLSYLQAITDIIYSEIKNPELSSTLIAEKMSVSVSQLNRKMNGITGKSTISYILQVKLNKAKRLLNDNTQNLSMLDIAVACGFYDANYFSRVFKKEFGVSPSQYQKLPQ